MSASGNEKGSRGGHGIAEGDWSTAIGGDAGAPGPKPGGRGGDAKSSGENSTVVGGKGGRGGAYPGSDGMDVADLDWHGDFGESYLEGGMGGEASQLDGRGGRGGRAPISEELGKALGLTWRPHMKRPYWEDAESEPGRGVTVQIHPSIGLGA